jgi:hypothetical protein
MPGRSAGGARARLVHKIYVKHGAVKSNAGVYRRLSVPGILNFRTR